MAENKKYYYIRLNENFFEREEIKIIESLPNGLEYSLILLKMYLKSLKRDGRLMVTDVIPYSPVTLSKVIGHNIDTVKNAIKVFEEFKLIEVLDNGAIYMNEIQSLIGKSSTEADRKREQRRRIENEKKLISGAAGKKDKRKDKCPIIIKETSENQVFEIDEGQMSDKHSRETEQEIETELEIQQQIERLIQCNPNEAKAIINTVKRYSNNKNVVAVVKEKIKIIDSGSFRNRLGALVTAIKENWIYSESKNSYNGFNNFEGRDYESGYGGETFYSLEKKLLGWDRD